MMGTLHNEVWKRHLRGVIVSGALRLSHIPSVTLFWNGVRIQPGDKYEASDTHLARRLSDTHYVEGARGDICPRE